MGGENNNFEKKEQIRECDYYYSAKQARFNSENNSEKRFIKQGRLNPEDLTRKAFINGIPYTLACSKGDKTTAEWNDLKLIYSTDKDKKDIITHGEEY